MNLKDLTPENIKAYLQGNIRLLLDEKFNTLAPHLKEQVAYRAFMCKDSCMLEGVCQTCGCELPGKLYVTRSCNKGEKFPDLMDEEDWNNFKIENKVNEILTLPKTPMGRG